MSDPCRQFDDLRPDGEVASAQATRWREHLAGCAGCRDQLRADALLRETLAAPAPELAAGFEERLRLRLERRGSGKPVAAGRQGRRGWGPGLWGSGRSGLGRSGLGRAGWWALAAYGTAAAAASVAILSSLPWQSLTLSPAWGMTLGGLALLSPLVLLDRIGIVRPPG